MFRFFSKADISFFHDFVPPPNGGGHQFMRALWTELEALGWRMENNRISRTTRCCLFNSYNFNFKRLLRSRRSSCRMVHRVDGPLCVYRGSDDGTDRKIWKLNRRVAHATIFQSAFSMDKHRELGFDYVNPTIIPNAVDPYLFHARDRDPFDSSKRIRLVSTSWSDNPNKGAAIYQWLDQHLDWSRYEYTFIGRMPVSLNNIKVLPPAPSAEVSALLRQSDVYITGSRHDPCSNSLVEALSCGLPAIYLNSGGHPEIAGEAGEPFDSAEEVPALLDKIAGDYAAYVSRISVPSIADVARRYLHVMGLDS